MVTAELSIGGHATNNQSSAWSPRSGTHLRTDTPPCMKRMTPVDIGQMIGWIAGGETPADSWKIGTEHEKFLFHEQDHACRL